ncbi:MAG: OmpH family outer membrane protein [Gemmatimonadaceae bacterium]
MRSFFRAAPLALAIAAAAASRPAQAQQQGPIKIAYLNSQVILQNAPGRAEAESQFEREMGGYRQQVQRMGDSLQTMIADYNKQEVSLSPAAKQTRQQTIRAREDAFQKRTQELEQKAQQRQVELVQPIMEKIQKVIADIRREDGYSMIFDAGSSAGALVAADTTLNITGKVLERMGVKATAVNAAPAPAVQTPNAAGAPLSAPAGVTRPKTPPTQ